MKIITVKAAPDVKVPMEGAARRYITDSEPVDVPESAYYLRRLDDGDLVRVEETAFKVKPKAKEAATEVADG